MKKHTYLWYHNHDICETSKLRRYFLGWWAARAEQNIFSNLSIFSLPANERKQYFSFNKFKGIYFFIPNYPSLDLYSRFFKTKAISSEVKLLYQGRISNGHGLEELIELLPEKIANKKLTLHIKGIGEIPYLKKLNDLAAIKGVEDQLFIYGLTSYSKVPELAAVCHIGVGIQTKNEIMHATLGTSSNKIYEYAATGMPVLLYENEHFREHLGKYGWTRFTNCSKESLKICIEDLIVNYSAISFLAYKDFTENLNFEKFYKPAIDYVKGL
ncbi:MAG: glycosyltransferase [Bacteroidetes bacterium]|nr:glycosyltransferase [Bacteroidota bacterium]